MLRLRLDVDRGRADTVTEALEGTGGVHRIVALNREGGGAGIVLAADVLPSAADEVMRLLDSWGVSDQDFLLTRQEVIAPLPHISRPMTDQGFAWIEVMGEARINARPLGRYLALMAVAAVIAGIGVITDNAILIVGAMAVSPDLLPICAACVAVVARRLPLALRALVTLVLGILLTWAVAAAVAWGLQTVGILVGDFQIHDASLHGLNHIDYSTVLVALAAGVAAMLSFETRAAAAVGVAISVTTIPASALFGVSIGLGEVGTAWGAAGVLGVNVSLLLISGTMTLVIQRRLAAGRAAAA